MGGLDGERDAEGVRMNVPRQRLASLGRAGPQDAARGFVVVEKHREAGLWIFGQASRIDSNGSRLSAAGDPEGPLVRRVRMTQRRDTGIEQRSIDLPVSGCVAGAAVVEREQRILAAVPDVRCMPVRPAQIGLQAQHALHSLDGFLRNDPAAGAHEREIRRGHFTGEAVVVD